MKNCESCGRSHHLHSENDLSNCLVWACDDVRRLRAEVDRLRGRIIEFCAGSEYADPAWRKQKHIQPLFDEAGYL